MQQPWEVFSITVVMKDRLFFMKTFVQGEQGFLKNVVYLYGQHFGHFQLALFKNPRNTSQ